LSICPKCGAEIEAGSSICPSCGASLNAAPDNASGGLKTCFYCGAPFVGKNAYEFHCKYCDQDFCSEHRLPEKHLCKSNPMRRTIPSTSMPHYSTSGGGYYSSSYRPSRGGSFLNISRQGKYLAGLIVAGLVLGYVFYYLVQLNGIPLVYYLIQVNALVYTGWYLPILTSMIIVLPGYLGLVDVVFNAISVIFVDRLLSYSFSFKQYFAVFVLTGVVGNLLSLLNGPNIESFGASGGIFGLVAGAVTCDYALNGRINRSLVIWFVVIFIYSSIAGSVDILAHAGGAASGLLAGYVIGRFRRRSS
jgi:rhomboid protease GluP